jgi:hypothetical protein
MTIEMRRPPKRRKLLKQRWSATVNGADGHNYAIWISRDTVDALQEIYEHSLMPYPPDLRVQDMAEFILRQACQDKIVEWFGARKDSR